MSLVATGSNQAWDNYCKTIFFAILADKALLILTFKLGITNLINSLLIGEGDSCMFNRLGIMVYKFLPKCKLLWIRIVSAKCLNCTIVQLYIKCAFWHRGPQERKNTSVCWLPYSNQCTAHIPQCIVGSGGSILIRQRRRKDRGRRDVFTVCWLP